MADKTNGERPSADELLLARLRASFSGSYMTLLSIVQGAALGFWAFTAFDKIESLEGPSVVLAFATLLLLVAVWNEYVMGATAFVWIPDVRDTLIPFALGASALYLISTLRREPRSWFFAAALVSVVAVVAYLNQYHRAKVDGGNTAVLDAIQRWRWITLALAAGSGVVTVLLGLLASPSRSEQTLIALSWIALAIVVVILLRARPYWNRILEVARSPDV